MNRFYIIICLIFGWIFAAMVLRDGRFISLVLPLVIYLIIGLMNQPKKPELEITRMIAPMRVFENTLVEIKVMVKNRGPTLNEVLFEDVIPPDLQLISGNNQLLGSLENTALRGLSYQVSGDRGVHQFSYIEVKQFDPFGLFQRNLRFPVFNELLILPDITPMKRLNFKPKATRIYGGNYPARKGGVGVDFFGVRPFSQGDPMRQVNWKASAHTYDTMYSNEFELERAADIWLVLDAQSQTNVTTPKGAILEKLVQATGVLSSYFLKGGNRVGLLVLGGYLSWTFLGYGKIQQERILQSLARVQPGKSLVSDRLRYSPIFHMPGKSLVTVVSTLNNVDISFILRLRSRGFQVWCISPNPITYEMENYKNSEPVRLGFQISLAERKLLINRLKQTGVFVDDWDTNIQFEKFVGSLSYRFLWRKF